ncbi:MAG: phosphoribosylformylglycinamidine synthase subunit PurS [Candidatus Zixiibacteriota bacterium]
MSSGETIKTATGYVRFKDGVLDPEGLTIQKSLATMGYDKTRSVRTGKFFEIELADDSAEARRQLEEMSEKALANPVIESFKIVWP